MSNVIHPAPRRRPALVLAAASVGALAALAVAGPILAQSEEPADEVYAVNAVTTDLGTFLTGEDGRTLYFFAKDTTPGASACEGDCVTNWPPFAIEEDETLAAGEGVTGVLATFARADGTTQASYDGRPLYYFAGDQAAGDTNGQGRGDVWYVAAVDGTLDGVAPSPVEGGLVVNTATTDLGTFLVDADGRTLYVFLKDTTPGASVCASGGCLESWPAFGPAEEGQGFAPGEGVTGVLGSFTRADDIVQATYDGRPLYHFVGDQAAGDTNGQGIGGVWYVASVDGSVPAPMMSMAPTGSPTAQADGY